MKLMNLLAAYQTVRRAFAIISFLCCVAHVVTAQTTNVTSQTSLHNHARVDLNGRWRFAIDPVKSGETNKWFEPSYDHNRWDTVDVPHCWSVDARYPFYTGTAWYRTTFNASETTDKHTRLKFDAVFYRSKVWLNGTLLGEHEGGYTPFEFDVSAYLKSNGPNTLVVSVDNSWNTTTLPGARPGADPTAQVYPWMDYGGIVRDTYLLITAPVYVHNQRITATPDLSNGSADIDATVFIRNTTNAEANAEVGLEITRDGNQTIVADWRRDPRLKTRLKLAANTTQAAPLRFSLPRAVVALWDVDHPNLYRVRSVLLNQSDASTIASANASAKDQTAHTATFGIRKIEVRGTQLLLNGEPVKYGGANRASDHPRFGLIEPREVIDGDLRLMKTAGMEMQRMIHYALPVALLDWADRHGMLIIAEAGNWQLTKEQMDSPVMRRKWQTQMREMVERDWNHPSVFAWSVGNEYPSDTPAGVRWTRDMYGFVKMMDSSRPITFADYRGFRSSVTPEENGSFYVDFVSINSYAQPPDFAKFLDTAHKNFPSKPIFVSEFGQRADGVNVSGKLDDEYKTQSARDKYLRDMIAAVRARPFVIGASLWTFNDYRSRYPGTNANGYRWWGMIDHNRQPRSAYHAMREEFSAATIDRFESRVADHEARITLQIGCRADFPAYSLRDYILAIHLLDATGRELKTESRKLPVINIGTKHDEQFKVPLAEATNATQIRIEVVRPTGFVAIERTQALKASSSLNNNATQSNSFAK